MGSLAAHVSNQYEQLRGAYDILKEAYDKLKAEHADLKAVHRDLKTVYEQTITATKHLADNVVIPKKGVIDLLRVDRLAEVTALIIVNPSNDFDGYAGAPPALLFEGRVHGRAGYDTDRGTIAYRDDVPTATICWQQPLLAH